MQEDIHLLYANTIQFYIFIKMHGFWHLQGSWTLRILRDSCPEMIMYTPVIPSLRELQNTTCLDEKRIAVSRHKLHLRANLSPEFRPTPRLQTVIQNEFLSSF